MTYVRLENVWKRFGANDVIKGIDLEIAEGEFVVMVGPSGCGKSTVLNLIAGLETLSDGAIHIGGRRVNDVAPKDRDIAMVFQSYALYPTKTVQDNILFGMRARGLPWAEQQEALARVSGLLKIDMLLDRKPGQLSGGQRQRVAMGRALVRDPDVFLFDEPLSNLDAKLRLEMRTEIKKLHKRLGKTMIYVTHDQIEAMTLASRIAVLEAGVIRQYGPPEEIYEAPEDLFVAGFIGSPPMNIVRGKVVQQDGLRLAVNDVEGTVLFPIPAPLVPAVSAHLGRDLKMGMRPETITRQGTQRSGANAFAFKRKIDVVEPTGPDTMLVFTLGGIEAIGRVNPEDSAPEGTLFDFEVNMERSKFFELETGKRLRATGEGA